MTELESYFINFEIVGDEMAENEPAMNETTEDDPTNDQTCCSNRSCIIV